MAPRSSGKAERDLAAQPSLEAKSKARSKGSPQAKSSAQDRWELCTPPEEQREESQLLAGSSSQRQSAAHGNQGSVPPEGSRWELAHEPQSQEEKGGRAPEAATVAPDQPISMDKQPNGRGMPKHKHKHKHKSKHKSKHKTKTKVKDSKEKRTPKSTSRPAAVAAPSRKRSRSKSRSPDHRHTRSASRGKHKQAKATARPSSRMQSPVHGRHSLTSAHAPRRRKSGSPHARTRQRSRSRSHMHLPAAEAKLLPSAVKERLESLCQQAGITLDAKAVCMLSELPRRDGLEALEEFAMVRPASIRSPTGYLIGIIARFQREAGHSTRHYDRQHASRRRSLTPLPIRRSLSPAFVGRRSLSPSPIPVGRRSLSHDATAVLPKTAQPPHNSRHDSGKLQEPQPSPAADHATASSQAAPEAPQPVTEFMPSVSDQPAAAAAGLPIPVKPPDDSLVQARRQKWAALKAGTAPGQSQSPQAAAHQPENGTAAATQQNEGALDLFSPHSGTSQYTSNGNHAAAVHQQPGDALYSQPSNVPEPVAMDRDTQLRQALMEFVKQALKPAWKAKRLNRDSFKLIAHKVVDKVVLAAPVESKHFDETQDVGEQFLTEVRKGKIQRLVDGYVVKHGDPQPAA